MNFPQIPTDVITFVESLPQVKSCELYGSFANGTADELSDIDIMADVSGLDNGRFMLDLPNRIAQKFNLLFYDFAPSLVPKQYIVSVAIDEQNPFAMIDLNCIATPHIETVQKSDLKNDIFTHTIKLWIANCKHFLRGIDCSADIQKMGKKIIKSDCKLMTDEAIIEEVLRYLEDTANHPLLNYINNCRNIWDSRRIQCLTK